MAGTFCISLDFELMWGVQDSRSIASYGEHILGVREAVPAMLMAFAEYGLYATWATVGLMACRNKAELMELAPSLRPNYRQGLSCYDYLDRVGENEEDDPYHYGESLIRQVMDVAGQEIGSHSFSHYYCAEDGASLASFEADILASQAIFDRYGVALKSYVFARNQWVDEYAKCLVRHGITHLRGNQLHWAYAMASSRPNSRSKRIFRLADCYFPFSGHQAHDVAVTDFGAVNVPSSQFFYPYQPGKLTALEPLRIERMKRAMTYAAKKGLTYHLWWHPHNFGSHLSENMAMLRAIGEHFRNLQQRYAMQSKNMGMIDA